MLDKEAIQCVQPNVGEGSDLSSSQKRRKFQTSGEPVSIEQVHLVPTLQKGGDPHCERSFMDRGLYDHLKDVYFSVPIHNHHSKYL